MIVCCFISMCVEKVGIECVVYEFVYGVLIIYGLFCVVLVMLVGYVVVVLFG